MSNPGSVGRGCMFEPNYPAQQETTEQIVQRKDLRTNRVEPDEVRKPEHSAGKHGTRYEAGDPADIRSEVTVKSN